MTSEPGFFVLAATGVACCTAACVLACVVIAQFTREKPRRLETQADREARELRAKVREYEGKYFAELAAAKEKCTDEKGAERLAGVSIEEQTPVGLVRMEYDPSRSTFDYYTDARNIGYKTLDAVARSFCLAHDCPHICVHYKHEFERAKAKAIAERDEARKKASESKREDCDEGPGCSTESSSVFAKFKTYNARASKPIKERPRILTENANRFSFKGSLKAREEEKEAESKKAKPTNPELTFADFKDKNA